MAPLDNIGTIRLIGDKALMKRMEMLSDVAASRIMRPALSKGLDPVKKQAKSNVKQNKRSGALYRSISKKTGISSRVKAWGKVYVKSKNSEWNGKKVNPVKYAHLLEFGTVHSRPYPFLLPSVSQARGLAIQAITREARIKLEKQVLRARRKFISRAIRRIR